VEFLADELNGQSRRALERIGAVHEGVLRSHYILPSGRVRNSVVYGVIASEWPVTHQFLEERLLVRS
jgi:RimJ/RimL family protein N-acetyltransferase